MTAALAALAAGWAVTLTAALALVRSERRAVARERDLLLNQLLHALGRTWTPPPADDTPAVAQPDEHDLIRPSQHFEL